MKFRLVGAWVVLIWASVPFAFLIPSLIQYAGAEGTRDALIVSAMQRFALRIPMIVLAFAYLKAPSKLRNAYWLLPVFLVSDAAARLFETSSWFFNQRIDAGAFRGLWVLLNMFFWVGLPVLAAAALWVVRPRPLVANAFYSERGDESDEKIPLQPVAERSDTP